MDTLSLVGLLIGLGLFGFIEPCTVGSHLLFVKYLENKSKAEQLAQTLTFTVTRAVFIGVLGALAALVGSAFLGLQQGFWILLGVVYVLLGLVYVLLGLVYLLGRQGALMRTLGPNLRGMRKTQGAPALGLVFGFNIPACAAPLFAAVLGANLGAATVSQGFLTMALFGVVLSLPLVAVVVWKRARGWLRISGSA